MPEAWGLPAAQMQRAQRALSFLLRGAGSVGSVVSAAGAERPLHAPEGQHDPGQVMTASWQGGTHLTEFRSWCRSLYPKRPQPRGRA